MTSSDCMRIALYNPVVSDVNWSAGSFRTEEMCEALSRLGVGGIVASPFLTRRRRLSDRFQAIPLPRSPSKCMKSFLDIVRHGDFDFVQERPFSWGIVRSGYGLAASFDRGLPLVTELHNIGVPSSYVRRLPVHIMGLWHSDLILAYAHVNRRMLFGADSDKVVVIPNGYPKEMVESVVDSREGQFDLDGLARGRKVFGFFGDLAEEKGVDIVLNVARGLRHREDICFVFAGTGNLVDRIRESSKAPGSNVMYLGLLRRYDALSCMSQCRSTFALHNPQQSAVGNPVKVIESVALGVPVIVNADMVMPERLKSHCIMTPGRDFETITDIVIDVADSDSRIHAPNNIEDFSIESISESVILPAYRRMLEMSRL